MGDMKQMEMKDVAMPGMPGMAGTPSVAVVVPAVARQLIGVRSAPAAYATVTQEIRAVGTVGYDERGLTQVTVKTPGWVREVFVDSIGRPVRKGEPLFTLYSPDLLATQDEYLLAVKTQAQLAISPSRRCESQRGIPCGQYARTPAIMGCDRCANSHAGTSR